jgi:YihY family inner membrane protein
LPKRIQAALQLVTKTWEQFGDDNCSQMAAAITYYVLFAVVPLTIFLVSVATIALPGEARTNATEWVENYLNVSPDDVKINLTTEGEADLDQRYGSDAVVAIDQGLQDLNTDEARVDERLALAEMVESGEPISVAGYELSSDEVDVESASFVSEIMQQATDAAVPLGIVGFVAMAFSASIAFSAIRRSLNFVWNVPHRPFVQQRLMELVMLVGLVLLLGASVFITTMAQILREAADGSQNFIATADGLAWLAFGYVLPWSFTFILIVLAYRYVPNDPTNKLRYVWLGAVLASGAVEVLKYGYGVYVVNFANYGPAYGALAGVLLFMFFVWLSSYIFLMGAELSATYPRVMSSKLAPEPGSEPLKVRDVIVNGIRGLFVDHRPSHHREEADADE